MTSWTTTPETSSGWLTYRDPNGEFDCRFHPATKQMIWLPRDPTMLTAARIPPSLAVPCKRPRRDATTRVSIHAPGYDDPAAAARRVSWRAEHLAVRRVRPPAAPRFEVVDAETNVIT